MTLFKPRGYQVYHKPGAHSIWRGISRLDMPRGASWGVLGGACLTFWCMRFSWFSFQFSQLLHCCHHFSLTWSYPIRWSDRAEKLTCLELFKILGRYQANIIPCISTIMRGPEMGTRETEPSSGGYHFLWLALVACLAFIPEFAVVWQTFSA